MRVYMDRSLSCSLVRDVVGIVAWSPVYWGGRSGIVDNFPTVSSPPCKLRPDPRRLRRRLRRRIAWGMIVDKFRRDRYDIAGAVICLLGVAVIMYAPRAT